MVLSVLILPNNIQVAGCCFTVFGFAVLIYLASMIRLWYGVWRHMYLISSTS